MGRPKGSLNKATAKRRARRGGPWKIGHSVACAGFLWLGDATECPFHLSVVGATARELCERPSFIQEALGPLANEVVCLPFMLWDA